MRIDLHTHSARSDGTVPPAGLVRAAREAGLDVVALTDHDTTGGWDEAAAAAVEKGIELVPGLELSTIHLARSVHLLGYYVDPVDPALVAELARIVDGRTSRGPLLLAKLHEAGADITADDIAAATPPGAVPGRPHIADALVAKGLVATRDEAFATWLGPRGRAFVRRYSPTLAEGIALVLGAGGVPVIAHPRSRGSAQVLDDATIARFAGEGLAGVEVDHQDHPPAVRERLRGLAADLDLVVTGSSDWHGAGKADHDLGCNTTDPEQYERLRELAGVLEMSPTLLVEVFVTLFVIMDPVGTIPIFLSLTSGRSQGAIRRAAWQAVVVSFGVICAFAFFGQQILSYLHISLPALQCAGGLLLLLVALELLTGKEDPQSVAQADTNVALVPLGTPLLAGPGAIVATMVFSKQVHHWGAFAAVALGIVLVHVSLWLAMRFSLPILRLIRESGVLLVTRIAGLLLSAIAVQMVADAVRAFIAGTG